jgi:hypothetical protein
MSADASDAAITPKEILARFVIFARWVRKDNTVKQDAFLPYPHRGLSVTRHRNLSELKLWQIGQGVAGMRSATLRGRADITAAKVRLQPLEVNPDPIAGNPNHANITGWCEDKQSQKEIALELAKDSTYHPVTQA